MKKSINFQKLATKSLVGILVAGSMFTQLATKKAVATDSNSSSNGVFGLELHYRDSAFQCGSNSTQADIKVKVYDQNNNLLTTMSKGDKYKSTSFDSLSDFRFDYQIYNLNCISDGTQRSARGTELLASGDTVPVIGGFSGQASIREMLTGLDSYEELYLVELGSSNPLSSAYDLQDVVVVVDNNPAFAD